MPDASKPDSTRPDSTKLAELLASESHWTAQIMQQQGSRFYRALGQALEAADAQNRRRIYETWTAEVWDFYQRGLRLRPKG